MCTESALLSLMDLLDLDEEVIDRRLKSIMMRDSFTEEHLNSAIQLLQYKYMINVQENTECDNDEELLFIAKLMKQINSGNIQNVCKIIKIVLSLKTSKLVSNAEHFLQQIFSNIPIFETPFRSVELLQVEETVIQLKLSDSILDAVTKVNEMVMLPFLNLLLLNILYSPNESLRVHFLVNTVPKLFAAVHGTNILDLIWTEVKSKTLPNDYRAIGLKVLSCLSDYYLPVPDNKGFFLFNSTIVFETEFWDLVVYGMMFTDPTIRRLSIYLSKRAIDCLTAQKLNKSIKLVSEKGVLFTWNHMNPDQSKNKWYSFFILMDSLDEKQSNIVLPSLNLFNTLSDIDDCWLNAAFNIGLRHENAQVRLKCIEQKLLRTINSEDDAIILLEAINDINIYTQEYQLKNNMINFMSNLNVFIEIIKIIPIINWSPIPLYHMSDVLANLNVNLNIQTEISQDDMTSIINKIFKIPCNIVMIRKAVLINTTRFVGNCCKHLEWKNMASILSALQDELGLNLKVIIKQCNLDVFGIILKNYDINIKILFESMIDTHAFIDFGLLYLDNKPENETIFLSMMRDVMVTIQDITARQYSNKRVCLNNAIFIIKLNDSVDSKNFDTHTVLTNDMKVILYYILSLFSNDINLEIDEIDSITNCLISSTYVDEKETLVQLYKVSLVMLTDNSANLDKIVLSMFVIVKLRNNPVLINQYKQEMVNLRQILHLINIFDNKQSLGRFKNAFYEKSCKLLHSLIISERFENYVKDILDSIEILTERGGYGCLKWILRIINEILPSTKDTKFDKIRFIDRMWKEIEELKSSNEYSKCIEEFVNLITHEALFEEAMYNNHIISYCNKIVEYGPVKNTPLYFLTLKLSTMKISQGHFLFVLFEILLYSPVPRKDQSIAENLMNEIIQNPKYGGIWRDLDSVTHFNYEIQYTAVSTLCNLDKELLLYLNQFIINKIELLYGKKTRYHGNSQPHRTILTALQHLLFVKLLRLEGRGGLGEGRGGLDEGRGGGTEVVNWCIDILGKLPHQPSVRICLEWYIALYYYTRNIPLNEEVINIFNIKKVPLTSQFTILYWIAKQKISQISDTEYDFVIDHLLSYTMGQIFNIRLHAQYLATKLYINSKTKYSYTMELIKKTFKESCTDKNYIRLKQDYFLNDFNIIEDLTPSFIYYFIPNYTGMNIEKLITYKMEMLEEINRSIELKTEKILKSSEFVFNFEYPRSIHSKVVENGGPMDTIQKKYIPWKNMSDVDVYQVNKKEVNKSDLIVVASLIDKLPNLGGMARTSEVFGVKTYVVDSLRHLQDKQFQGLSVSAERWVDIVEVRPGAPLKEYLLRKKNEGYSIVAAEQTSTSCPLQTFKFPKKTLLLLGHEKEGVPCDLLPIMDHCVEIPQQGVVRSLNVHVTAAIFVWEYSRQHIL